MKKRLRPLRFLLGFCLTLTGAGCGTSPSTTLKLALVANNSSDFWMMVRRGVERAERELPGVYVDFKIPAAGTSAEQTQIVKRLLQEGVSGIAISPVDPLRQTGMINNAASRILMVTQDSDAPNSKRAFYVGTDNAAAGAQAGRLVREVLPAGGRIMAFVGHRRSANARQRLLGLQQELDQSGVTVINTLTDGNDPARARANVLDTLVQFPEVSALVGLWGYNCPAIVHALHDVGQGGKIPVICFDAEDETLEAIQNQEVFATVVQQPEQFGYQVVRLMTFHLRPELFATAGLAPPPAIPPGNRVLIPTRTVRRSNVEEFIRELNEGRAAEKSQ